MVSPVPRNLRTDAEIARIPEQSKTWLLFSCVLVAFS